MEMYDTFKYNGVTDNAIRLRQFLFSLRDKAKHWLYSLFIGSITTWKELSQSFLAKDIPSSRIAKLHNDILTFTQLDMETLHEVWRDSRICQEDAHIMAYSFGCKFKYFILVYLLRIGL